MDRPEGFLGRWSRLKTEAETRHQAEALPEEKPETGPASDAPCPPEVEPEGAPDREAPAGPPPLPPIESLGADSDYRPFLASGVPEELRRLAMRRAWVTDPKISGFRGFGEYDWDCNAPGYGRLLATDDIGRLLDAVCRTVEKEPSREQPGEPVAETGEMTAEADGEMRPDGEPAPLPPSREESLVRSDEPRRVELPRPGDETSDVRKC